jgi:hypothetical protein
MVTIATVKWRCWFGDDGDDAHGMDVDVMFSGESEAAKEAAEGFVTKREQSGAFAGDPIPDVIEVYARAPSGQVYIVEVNPSYSVGFYACRAKAMP